MFASRVTKEIPLPSDPAVTVTIRKLSGLQLKSARQLSKQENTRDVIASGGAEFMRAVQDLNDDPAALAAAAAAAAEQDPLEQHDLLTVLVCGVKAWTAPEPVERAFLEDLGDEDATGLAAAILALSIRRRTEAEEKNARGPSTATLTAPAEALPTNG